MRIGVVGAGIIGLGVARRLGEVLPDATVTVLEKEHEIATHQTGRNSGVVHAGIYYAPGSLKSRMCRRGVELLTAYAEQHGIALERCGKLVVALDETEAAQLRANSSAAALPTVLLAFAGWRAMSYAKWSRTPLALAACTRQRHQSPTTERWRPPSPTTCARTAALCCSTRPWTASRQRTEAYA